MKKGILYGIGVGPGDPELMTLKAVRMIKENKKIAVPVKERGSEDPDPGKDVLLEDPESSLAYNIALQAVPELREKELIPVFMPMIKDKARLEKEHLASSKKLMEILDSGENIVYLTLGDPTIYSSFSYLKNTVEKNGYETETISGIPSFCAAAAKLGISLADWDEPLHIIPGAHQADGLFKDPGTCVFMKSSGHVRRITELSEQNSRKTSAVINCGLKGESVCKYPSKIPDAPGYFTLLISKP